jgi:radical SAM PhpK family P-methyltransferase
MTKTMAGDSGAYQDLRLAFIEWHGKPYRPLDLLNHFYFQDKQKTYKPFHNADFLWPVITYLGTYLSRRGLTFDYINLFQKEKQQLKEKLLTHDILTIAITTTLYVFPHPIMEIVSFIRQYNSTAKIVIGGPYILNQVKVSDGESLQHLLNSLGGDFYVINSQGEHALVNLINALKNGNANLETIANIAFKKGDEFILTSLVTEHNPLEENMVDYSLFPMAAYGELVSTRTARSCPFACAFCGFPQRAGKYTYLSVEMVEKELERLSDLGTVTTITFLDDTFNVPKERFKALLRLMIKNRYGFKWNCCYRCDHGDRETIHLMKEAGCEGVFLGVESGSDTMLKRMNKTARRKHYLDAIPLFNHLGISTYASFIIGFPGETPESVQETIDLIEEAQPEFFRTQLWYCDQITPIWSQREEYNLEGFGFKWSHRTMNARKACDFIEKIFLSIENSIWLPQFGFEQWSTFYLQRKGMSMDRIKAFLKSFNAVLKYQILHPGNQKEIDNHLLENLEKCCHFDVIPAARLTSPLEEILPEHETQSQDLKTPDHADDSFNF